jgi:hypothetical protein
MPASADVVEAEMQRIAQARRFADFERLDANVIGDFSNENLVLIGVDGSTHG